MSLSDNLFPALGYRFSDESLLVRALSHRSAGKRNYERLEFLGDSILGFIIAEQLYTQFPRASEGELSRYRAELVQQATLAALARDLGLGSYLVLGRGERKDGGADRDSILADAFEALVSAVYMDAGLARCKATILPLFKSSLSGLDKSTAPKDFKTRLQEEMQKLRMDLPEYRVLDTAGAAHNQQFVVECLLSGMQLTTEGRGGSRKEAEQQAAETALNQLQAAKHDN